MTGMAEPGERIENEPPRAFAAFAAYRDMGPERTAGKVAEQIGKGVSRVQQWSAKYGWVARCEAWDAAQDAVRREAVRRGVSEMTERHVRIAVAAQNKIIARLAELDARELSPMALMKWLEVTVRVERLSRGEPTDTVRSQEEQLGHTVVNDDEAAELAARLVERLSLGAGSPGRPGTNREPWPMDYGAASGGDQPGAAAAGAPQDSPGNP